MAPALIVTHSENSSLFLQYSLHMVSSAVDNNSYSLLFNATVTLSHDKIALPCREEMPNYQTDINPFQFGFLI